MKKYTHISFWIALVFVFVTSSAFVSIEEHSQNSNFVYSNFDNPLHKIELTEAIASSGCTSCHMEYSVDGKSISPIPVHLSRSIDHKGAIQHFVNTHNHGQAEEKTIDLNKLINYLETLP